MDSDISQRFELGLSGFKDCPELTATHIIRTMTGKSKSFLARCDDSHLYIVKSIETAKGPNSLANELLGYRLLSAMGLTVPPIACVKTPQFLTAHKHRQDDAGVGRGLHNGAGHFGSRYVGDSQKPVYDFIPSTYIPRIANRSEFLGMLIVDIWANTQAVRQAVLSQSSRGGDYTATFIDQGSMFGGTHCCVEDSLFAGLFNNLKTYQGLLSEQEAAKWIHLIRERGASIIESTDIFPNSWGNFQHRAVRETLLSRLPVLETLVQGVFAKLSVVLGKL